MQNCVTKCLGVNVAYLKKHSLKNIWDWKLHL